MGTMFFATTSRAQATPEGVTPAITFSFEFPGSIPERYNVRIDESGHARYESGGKMTADAESDGDPFTMEFQLSSANRVRLFGLAAKANHFSGDFDYKKGRLANTGKKTLAYRDREHRSQTTYNYSTSPAIQQLTQFFQNLAGTMEFARRLQYDHQYQRLALEAELKRMEEVAAGNMLEELQAVAPILRKIVADAAVLNVTRVRAQRLLARAEA